jgi:hypothetical protein
MKILLTMFTCLLMTTACAKGDQLSQQANFVTKLFMDSCSTYLGDNKAVSEWAKKNNLVLADEQFSKVALRGEPGEVWGGIKSAWPIFSGLD